MIHHTVCLIDQMYIHDYLKSDNALYIIFLILQLHDIQMLSTVYFPIIGKVYIF